MMAEGEEEIVKQTSTGPAVFRKIIAAESGLRPGTVAAYPVSQRPNNPLAPLIGEGEL